jgi:ATP-dependent Clp protease ATP-binding subunit ClpB
MTSNLGSEEIRAASPRLHKLVATTEDRHEQYRRGIGQFTKQLYPVLKESLKRDEFLGRISGTDQSDRSLFAIEQPRGERWMLL